MVADFNDDTHPDLVIQNATTHETVVAYLDNIVVVWQGRLILMATAILIMRCSIRRPDKQ